MYSFALVSGIFCLSASCTSLEAHGLIATPFQCTFLPSFVQSQSLLSAVNASQRASETNTNSFIIVFFTFPKRRTEKESSHFCRCSIYCSSQAPTYIQISSHSDASEIDALDDSTNSQHIPSNEQKANEGIECFIYVLAHDKNRKHALQTILIGSCQEKWICI